MQDFLRLSTPVGASQNDDTILAQALHESRQSGRTYRQALEGLHGVNNHAANLWKDYYLDHHDRLDLLVTRLAEQPKTVKKPTVPSKSIPRSVTPTTSVLTRPPKRPRATFNSLSAPLPSNDVPNLMPPQVHIPLPEPPSRSPTPPAVVQVGNNGNRYTKEDREYFLKFLVWRLKQDPSLTKKDLCELLREKAPHHSASSWASHWHQRHDIADKILATYHDNSEADAEDQEDQQNEEEEVEVEEEIKTEDEDAESRGVIRSEGTFSDFGDPDVDTEEDEADMGEPGSSFTRGDWRLLAKFIAKNHWDEMSPRERWQSFTEAVRDYPQRPGKSWAEFYRRNEAGMSPIIHDTYSAR
ncbi:hypothetical protein OG21DRAFT_1401960 [Imleria badia]|nr:hypothetical protein OG21DRAFT_1401960 [Imleria badia]